MRKIEVDVYWIDLDSQAGQLDIWSNKISRDDRSRAQGLRIEQERTRFLVRRGWMRELLSQRLGVPPSGIPICRSAFGKPYIPQCGLRFNLSHSAGTALFVIADGLELGCDLEQINRDLASASVAARFFSEFESRCLSALAEDEWPKGFFNCWTRKEAYLKALGSGLSDPLDSFDVSLAPDENARLLNGCEGWSVRSFAPVPGFVAAVVAPGDNWVLNLRGCATSTSS